VPRRIQSWGHAGPSTACREKVSPTAITEISRTRNPYPRHGVQADENGVPCYTGLPGLLIAMLARQVENGPGVEAVVEVGGVAVAVNTRSSQPEVDFVLQDAGVTVDLAADSPLPDGDPLVVDGLGLRDVAAFFYTSGTTGNPKGVPTTHEAFLTNAENMRTCLGLPAGCNSQLLLAARVGGTSVILQAFDQAKMIASLPLRTGDIVRVDGAGRTRRRGSRGDRRAR